MNDCIFDYETPVVQYWRPGPECPDCQSVNTFADYGMATDFNEIWYWCGDCNRLWEL